MLKQGPGRRFTEMVSRILDHNAAQGRLNQEKLRVDLVRTDEKGMPFPSLLPLFPPSLPEYGACI